MLSDQIRTRMLDAMKRKDAVEKSILSVALGDIQTEQARSSTPVTDEQAARVVRKIIKSNDETIALTKDTATLEKLKCENTILASLLPRTMSVEQIVESLRAIEPQLKAAGNDGQATGAAMKHLKAAGLAVDGKDVAAAIKQIRG